MHQPSKTKLPPTGEVSGVSTSVSSDVEYRNDIEDAVSPQTSFVGAYSRSGRNDIEPFADVLARVIRHAERERALQEGRQ